MTRVLSVWFFATNSWAPCIVMNRPLRSPGIDGFTDATSNESCAAGPACDTMRTVPRSSAATHKIALMAPPMRERTRKRPLKTLERVLS